MERSTLVEPGTRVRLRDHDPGENGNLRKGDPEVRRKLRADLEGMSRLQERLYAENRQSLLLVLQAMDAGGKDGTIKHVMGGLNPQSCRVVPFRVPTEEERSHDFLWRVHRRAPRKGEIVVFNRSHYEDVLVVRVHELAPKSVWKNRFRAINDFERLLVASGTRILKIFLHISKDEQKERIQARIDDPEKHWKISASDFTERKLWDEYVAAYEEALTRCSTRHAPWHIVPANHKWYRNLVVADLVEKTLRDMDPQWPPPSVDVDELKLE